MKDQLADDRDGCEGAALVSALGAPRRSRRCESADHLLAPVGLWTFWLDLGLWTSPSPTPRPGFTLALSLKPSAFSTTPSGRSTLLNTGLFQGLHGSHKLQQGETRRNKAKQAVLPNSEFHSLGRLGMCFHLSSILFRSFPDTASHRQNFPNQMKNSHRPSAQIGVPCSFRVPPPCVAFNLSPPFFTN
jgi:hypothetical protein